MTKVSGSGGLVNIATCTEQLLYEVHDPAAYVTPDVVADFSLVTMEADGVDRVRVSGANGRPRPEMLKVSVGQHDGSIGEGRSGTAGRVPSHAHAWRHEIVAGRLALAGPPSTDVRYDLIGLDALHGGVAGRWANRTRSGFASRLVCRPRRMRGEWRVKSSRSIPTDPPAEAARLRP